MRLYILLVHAVLVAQSIAALFPPGNETTHSAAVRACQQLDHTLGPSLVQSSGAEYEAAATNAWNLLNAEFAPTCIVFPQISQHVQTAMKAIYDTGSHYAVQAGSHSAMKGWNTVQDGVLIMFSQMKNASYDPVTDSITLEPGIHWQEAITAVEPFGVAPVGGRASDVGTGLLLGGGLSWLSPSQGYAADTFEELDVVLVTGEMVTATATNEYSDLFRALKGGGNRFGIVTRYKISAVHTGTNDDKSFFGGAITYNSSSAEALLKATARYVRETNDPKAVSLVTFTNVMADGQIFSLYNAFIFYNGPELPAAIFGDFISIPAVSSQLGPLSYLEVAGILGLENDRGYVHHFGASALVGDEALFLDAFNHWSNFSATFVDSFNETTLAFTPIPDSQIHAGRARGGNIISAPHGQFAAVQLDQQLRAGLQDLPRVLQNGIDLLFEQIPPSPGLPLYLNECDAGQKVFQSYSDFELLKTIYAKYDPTGFNVAHTQGPIGL
ncbi:FAD-binding domain-containing protein [Mycena alexandri]|uniref:FAD-binding domain-containing protein n=1 Tax=Mycena alexandri TaxID=1745969 RepID=A0AAD6TA83_9AGAR|nr:FAD-binding domain-containing protein [Mycena alexandri]